MNKPEWFKFDKDITDQELESELYILDDYEVESIDNYDSFIDKLRTDVRGFTTSFIEDETKLEK